MLPNALKIAKVLAIYKGVIETLLQIIGQSPSYPTFQKKKLKKKKKNY